MKEIVAAILILLAAEGFAQSGETTSKLIINGYAEAYYTYDFNNPEGHNRPGFVYSHNRHNEVNLNLGIIKVAYQNENVRANLALMAGTYTNANLAAEPGVLRNIYEANAGVKIAKKKNLWIDAGIFTSHIGFESAIGKDCWNLTRSILADNSPYYETGAKISYSSDNDKWFISASVLNGWQRIQRVNGNNTPAFGHQLTYKPSNKVTLNSSSFIGNDKPDSVRQMRYFHNLYGIFQLTDKFSLTAGFDIGAEQRYKGSSNYNTWYSPVLMARFTPADKHHVSARVEYYSDPQSVIVSTGTAFGFNAWGYSLNYDYDIRNNVMWRIEARGFSAKDEIFTKPKRFSENNFFVSTALAISF